MKKPYLLIGLTLLFTMASGCDLEMGSGTSTSSLNSSTTPAAQKTATTTPAAAAAATTPDAQKPATTADTDSASDDTQNTTPVTQPVTTPVVTPAPVVPDPVPTPPVVAPINTGGALYSAGGNSITLRSDFAAVVSRVDALVNINESAPGKASSTAIGAVRSGNTWIIPTALASYPVGNRPNTWRIRLTGTPPAGVTYHTSIMQAFVRTTDFGTGKTYPPTTRQ